MKNQKIILNFSKLTDADFLTKAQLIFESMTGNPAFTDPIPTLAQLQTAITNYSNSLVAAAALGRNNVAVKNECRLVLEQLLYQLGNYVLYVANNNATVLISSGYTLAKLPEPQQLETPGVVTISNGISSGQLVSSIPYPGGALSFSHEISAETPTEETVWIKNPSPRCKHVFTNLTPGKQYWVRVGAAGSKGQPMAYSPVSSQFSQ